MGGYDSYRRPIVSLVPLMCKSMVYRVFGEWGLCVLGRVVISHKPVLVSKVEDLW